MFHQKQDFIVNYVLQVDHVTKKNIRRAGRSLLLYLVEQPVIPFSLHPPHVIFGSKLRIFFIKLRVTGVPFLGNLFDYFSEIAGSRLLGF